MKVKPLIFALRNSKTPPTEVVLERFTDGNSKKEFHALLRRLRKSQVTKVTVRTDFLIEPSDEDVVALFETLAVMTHLTELCIQSSSRFHVQMIPQTALKKTLQRASKLQTLVLEDLQVTALYKDSWIDGLASALEHHTTLTTIRLRNFFANDWANTTPNVLDPLVKSLSTASQLETLELSGCGSHALNGQQSVHLLSPTAVSKLFEMSKLVTLELSFLEMEDTHFQTIASQLRVNDSLHTVLLDYHKLNRDGLQDILSVMEKNNTTIKTLSLRSIQDIGDVGYQQAMTMLQHNYVIENLAVTASTPDQQGEIDLYLRMNAAGRRLLRDDTTSLNQWMEILAKHSDDLDVTRHLLQQIPGLCNNSIAETTTAAVPA